MKKTVVLVLALAMVGVFVLSACGGGSTAPAGGGGGGGASAVPAPYTGKTNPKANDAAAAEAGKAIYASNCATCHGDKGMGDGPSAATLDPKPKALATEIGNLKDDYLVWRISEGGAMAPYNSAMPAWKNSLSEDQIWQVISFLRTLK
jgi:mono/diheme cytochrome c family protein